jgi:hypothetical protein
MARVRSSAAAGSNPHPLPVPSGRRPLAVASIVSFESSSSREKQEGPPGRAFLSIELEAISGTN